MSRGDSEGLRLRPWSLVFEHFQPQHEGTREALCTLGNGRFATRGAAIMQLRSDAWFYPGTYVAGLYDRLSSRVDDREMEYEELVNLPNWLGVELSGFAATSCEVQRYRRELDLARGVLSFQLQLCDARGRVLRIEERRFVHMGQVHLAGQQLRITGEGFNEPLQLGLVLDGAVQNTNADEYAGLDRRHLEAIETGSDGRELSWLYARTRRARIDIALAARQRVSCSGQRLPFSVRQEAQRIVMDVRCTPTDAAPVCVERVIALYSSRDRACLEPRAQALRALSEELDFAALERGQARVWQRLWQGCALELPGQEAVLGTLHLNLFHILQTLSPQTVDIDAGLPARGLHGENYRGHVFWDELFSMPILNLRWPELTRRLLLYRYHRLDEARRSARLHGLRGAMYPWRSASDGREVTDPMRRNPRTGKYIPDHSRLQRHINAAIVFNVWHYVQVSGDLELLQSHGAELILSIAQFWASAAHHDPVEDRYHVRGVVGPDEFHDAYPGADEPGIDDNAYTNVMAVWCLLRAQDVLARLPDALRETLLAQLEISAQDLERWEQITRRMAVPFQRDGVIIDQFAGFEQLEPFDWKRYQRRYGNIQRLDDILNAEGDSVNRFQVCKQADVLMLFYLLPQRELCALFERLGYAWGQDAYRENVRYYLARTSHGSTLSKVVHAWVLTRLDRECSWRALTDALGSDLHDVQGGSTREGVHLGAMAGTLDVFQGAYLGLEVCDERLLLAPQLPPELPELQMSLRYRMQWLELRVTRETLHVRSAAHGDGAASLEVDGRSYVLTPGVEHVIALSVS